MLDNQRLQNLLERTPRAPESTVPQGASEADLKHFEATVPIRLPEALRDWLKLANGGAIGPGGLFGVGSAPEYLSIGSLLERYPTWMHKKWVPIGGDGSGNYYL